MNKQLSALAAVFVFSCLLFAQEAPSEREEPSGSGAFLRVWCGLAPQQPPKELGYRMPFDTPRRLVFRGPKGEEIPLYNQVTPFMVRGYSTVPPGKGRLELLENLSAANPAAGSRILAGVAVNLEKSKYYTAAIWLESGKIAMQVWEDLPAILPPPEPDAPAPPPTRNLRLISLVPSARAVVVSKQAGINLAAGDGEWPKKEGIPPGNWKATVAGITGSSRFQSELDIDFTQPKNYSILLIGNSYNRTSVRLMQDAAAPAD